jgi:hypothetical protein
MSNAVLWQYVFQVVVCVLGAVQRALHAVRHSVHTPQPETHAANALHHL